MLTCQELREIISSVPKEKINSHVHTHLCDGKSNMTVANIAAKAEERCRELGIPFAAGTDAHGLGGV